MVPRDTDSPNLAEIREYLTRECKIAIWKVPERIEVVDSLPVTATGKIQKFVLRNQLTAESKG